jgi:hypothetical protein
MGKRIGYGNSSRLLEKYQEWATLNYDQFQKYSAQTFAIAFKKMKGDDPLTPKDYSPIYKHNIRQLPIDWRYWRLRLQQLDLDLNFTIDADELTYKPGTTGNKKQSSESNSTIDLEIDFFEKEREESNIA